MCSLHDLRHYVLQRFPCPGEQEGTSAEVPLIDRNNALRGLHSEDRVRQRRDVCVGMLQRYNGASKGHRDPESSKLELEMFRENGFQQHQLAEVGSRGGCVAFPDRILR